MSKNRLYWLCQVAGWGGLVGIETINYTFFIVGQFSIEYVILFTYCSIVGLLSTHVYKKILCRTTIFEKPTGTIWFVAVMSSFLLSVWLTVVSFIPSLTSDIDAVKDSLTFISIFGSIINWMRYVAVWVIIYFMYRLMERNREVEQNKLKSESLARLTELELLKTQLNPHFLFNALNSIKALVTIDPDKSKDAIVKLSELLRFTLNYGLQPLIPLRDEMEEVRKYLSLEKIRFGERFHIHYDISTEALARLVPPAIVLTLAENSIKHGIAQHAGVAELVVKACYDGNLLKIETNNPGTLRVGASDGIGIRNIQKRLDSLFGRRARFVMEERNPSVIVSIEIRDV